MHITPAIAITLLPFVAQLAIAHQNGESGDHDKRQWMYKRDEQQELVPRTLSEDETMHELAKRRPILGGLGKAILSGGGMTLGMMGASKILNKLSGRDLIEDDLMPRSLLEEETMYELAKRSPQGGMGALLKSSFANGLGMAGGMAAANMAINKVFAPRYRRRALSDTDTVPELAKRSFDEETPQELAKRAGPLLGVALSKGLGGLASKGMSAAASKGPGMGSMLKSSFANGIGMTAGMTATNVALSKMSGPSYKRRALSDADTVQELAKRKVGMLKTVGNGVVQGVGWGLAGAALGKLFGKREFEELAQRALIDENTLQELAKRAEVDEDVMYELAKRHFSSEALNEDLA